MKPYKPLIPKTVFIGIDAGVSGGIAIISKEPEAIAAFPMPDTMRGILKILSNWVSLDEMKAKCVCVGIEKVTGYMAPSRGAKEFDRGNMPGARMFTFGRSYGSLLMASVACLDMFPLEISPRTWQSFLSIPFKKKGENREDFKRRLRYIAQSMYPGANPTLKTCDAILIAEYLRRTNS